MRCTEVHGFNYDGSWGTSGLDLWQHHDHGMMAVEIARGKRYFPGWNVCRWWLSEESFQRNPERFLAHLEAGLGLFAQHGISVIPLLFNRWRDPVCDFGGVSLEHVVAGLSFSAGTPTDLFAHAGALWPRQPARIEKLHLAYLTAVIGAHKDDSRIFAWDLCNEPLMGPYVDDADNLVTQGELRWLRWVHDTCKRLGATQPFTIGNYGRMAAIELTEPLSDIISIHPYFIWNDPNADKSAFERQLDACVSFAAQKGKELLASETVWGALDDAKHVEIMHYTLGQLRQRRIGFIVHALQHSLVADLHYPAYGPVGYPETLHFVNADGSLRPGHEAFNDYCTS